MNEKEIEEKVYQLLNEFRRITPLLVMRRFKLTYEKAQKLCHIVWLRMRNEALIAAAELDCNGWPPQMDKVKLKNLEKIKRKRKS